MLEPHTKKEPGHLVLAGMDLFIVGDDGKQRPHEQPHRKAQRERAEAARARLAQGIVR